MLLLVLPDEHESVDEVRAFILSAPPSYTRVVLSLFNHRALVGQTSTIQKWVLDTVLKLLLSPRWFLLGADGVSSATSIMLLGKEEAFLVASKNGLSLFQLELFREFLSQIRGEFKLDRDYGLINGFYYPHDWTTGTFEIGSWVGDLPREPSTNLGFLDLLYRVYRFASERNLSSLLSVLDYLEEEEILQHLPKRITAYLPLDESIEICQQIDELRSLDETKLNHLLTDRYIGARRVSRPVQVRVPGTPVFDLQQWKDLVDELPRLALLFWPESIWDRFGPSERPRHLDTEDAVNALVGKLLQRPDILIDFPYLWGRLLAKAPNHEKALRQVFREVAAKPVTSRGYWHIDFHAFSLNLPSEASLLPHLFVPLIESAETGAQGTWHRVSSAIEPRNPREQIARLVGDTSLLDAVIDDARLEPSVRVSAAFMSLIHPEGRSLETNQRVLVECYSHEISDWYFRAIRYCLTLLSTEADSDARALLGSALDLAREDYAGRQGLDPLLALWRETSHAPVQKANVQRNWLAGG